MKKITIVLSTLFLLFSTGFYSCVDIAPEEVLDYNDYYSSSEDADMAMLGMYGQFMELAAQVVVLNELKADLMDVTNNATPDFEEINLNIPSKDNKWADVTKFYAVIQNCNDIIFNFKKMVEENKMIEAEYNERYAEVAAVRCWVYLQLGLIFGEIPYITEPIISLNDLEKYKNNVMNLDQLIPELIRVMESLPSLEPYETSNLRQTIDGIPLTRFFIHKKFLMGDLYLYNNDYEKAAAQYYDIMIEGAASSERTYTLYNFPWTSGTPTWHAVLYRDGKSDDAGSLYNGWATMFQEQPSARYAGDELIWCMTFTPNFAPEYPFYELFFPEIINTTGGTNIFNGKYYLQPSEYAVEDVWGAEIQKNNFPFDARGRTGAYQELNDTRIIWKYGTLTAAQNWILYRAGMLHLRYIEAVNRAGYSKLAWALLNDGLSSGVYDFVKEDGTAYPPDSIRVTGNSPFEPHNAPYSFDARWSDPPNPHIRGPWRSNSGVRGRAYLPNIPSPFEGSVRDYKEPNKDNKEIIVYLEEKIIREAALELGLEGHRWGDLVRIARRKNKENPGSGDKFLWDENIAKKHQRSGTQADMSSESKWFLPLYY